MSHLHWHGGVVNLDRLALSAHRLGEQVAGFLHRFPNAVGHEPRGLKGGAHRPVNLVAADAFLAAGHQVHRLQPDVERHMARLKYRADLHGKGLHARVALVQSDPGGFPGQLADLRPTTTPYGAVCKV